MTSSPTVRLSDFILENMEPILQAWEDFARTIEPAALTMDDVELRDHAKLMLAAIAKDLTKPQTAHQQAEKSKGKAPKREKDTAAETHAEGRLLSGYTVEQLVSEYRALRSSVMKLWASDRKIRLPTDMEDTTRFNEAIDQALAESVARYAQMVKRSQNMFLAILGHDLRNPLGTVITGASFLMRASDIPPRYILAATRMFNSGQRMNKLIGDLIDFTRTHLGSGLPIKARKVNLAEVCRNVVDELRTSHPERLIDVDAGGRFDAVVDPDRIAQVVSNLIGNALQYGAPLEPITVRLRHDENAVLICVNNKGTPIEPKKLGSIFEPLVRHATGETDYSTNNSLGIGLFIARQIVQSHKGSVAVESTQEAGTTFTVSLPIDAVTPFYEQVQGETTGSAGPQSRSASCAPGRL